MTTTALKPALMLEPSGIRAMVNQALATPGALRLEIGEPDRTTPEHIIQAAFDAARRGHTGYTATAGIPELRERLVEKLWKVNKFKTSVDRITVTPGAVGGLDATFAAILRTGDNILIPDPAWPNFAMLATLRGSEARGYRLRAENGFLPDLSEIEALTDDRTVAIVVNSPSNPLGTVFDAELLRELAEFAARKGLWLISDECYDQLTFDSEHVSTLAAAPEHADRIIAVYSFSKTYAMTGWRVGYTVSPPSLTNAIVGIQEATTACISAPSMWAAVGALDGPQDFIEQMKSTYRVRRDTVVDQLSAAGSVVFKPEGAFYVWVDLSGIAADSNAAAMKILRQRKVSLAPGTAFGPAGNGWGRISLASSEPALSAAVQALIELKEK